MSRSYKKIPITTDHGKYTYQDKRNANKKVRHTEDLPDGGSFKKVFNSYDIRDYSWGNYTWEEVWKEVNESEEKARYFYEVILRMPYTKEPKNEKELQRAFHKRIGK